MWCSLFMVESQRTRTTGRQAAVNLPAISFDFPPYHLSYLSISRHIIFRIFLFPAKSFVSFDFPPYLFRRIFEFPAILTGSWQASSRHYFFSRIIIARSSSRHFRLSLPTTTTTSNDDTIDDDDHGRRRRTDYDYGRAVSAIISH